MTGGLSSNRQFKIVLFDNGADMGELLTRAVANIPFLSQSVMTKQIHAGNARKIFSAGFSPEDFAVAIIRFDHTNSSEAEQLAVELSRYSPNTELAMCIGQQSFDWSTLFKKNQMPANLLCVEGSLDVFRARQMLQCLAEKFGLRQQLENERTSNARKLRQKNDQLNRMIQRLRESRDEIESGNQMKSEFLANVSHEMRTPVHAIQGISDLLVDTSLDDEQQEFVQTIRRSSELLLGIINNVLNFSRLQTSVIRLEEVKFDPERMLEGTVTVLNEDARIKGLDLGLIIKNGMPKQLFGDPMRIQQIVRIFAENAIKFTEKGSVLIEAEFRSDNLVISVTDTGIGIEDNSAKKLFEPFRQSDNSTTRQFGGIGLGLSVAQQLTILMNGDIGFKSKPGQGSMFWFLVPLKIPDNGNSVPLLVPEQIARQNTLIVTSSPPLSLAIRSYLEQWHMPSKAVTKRELAIEAIAESHYNVAFVDETMLDNASSLLEELRHASRNKQLRIVLCVFKSSNIENRREIRYDLTMNRLVRRTDLFETFQRLHELPEILDVKTIPAEPAKAGEVKLAKTAVTQETKSAPTKTPEPEEPATRILIVEDNRVNQRLLVKILTNSGFASDVAGNGQIALDLMAQKDYDIVLMDCHMPILDGFETTRQIRLREANEQVPPIPILALTANVLEGAREQCIEAGMNDYMTKPVNRRLLMEKIAEWLAANALPDTVSS